MLQQLRERDHRLYARVSQLCGGLWLPVLQIRTPDTAGCTVLLSKVSISGGSLMIEW